MDLGLVGMVMWAVSGAWGCLGYGSLVFWNLRNLMAGPGVRLAVSVIFGDLYVPLY